MSTFSAVTARLVFVRAHRPIIQRKQVRRVQLLDQAIERNPALAARLDANLAHRFARLLGCDGPGHPRLDDFQITHAAVERLVDLRTPIAGLVTAVKVSAGDFVTAGQQLATVATTDRLRIKFGINPEDIAFVGKGAGVSISSDVVAEGATGTVLSVATSADPITRTFQVEALIDNDKGLFKPGMFVNVLITRQKLTNIIAVPREAVLTLDNRQVVYVVVNGVAHKRPVTLGADLDGVVVAASGLAVGDTVVTLGQNYLDEGFKVNVTAVNEGTK